MAHSSCKLRKYWASFVLSFAIPALCIAEDGAPSEAALRSAQITVKNVFKADLQKTAPADRAKLVAKMIEQARDPANDLAIQAALLLEAGALATPDSDTVMWVNDELDIRFPTALFNEKLAIVERAVRNSGPAKSIADLIDVALSIADSAGWAGDFRSASRGAEIARTLAKRSRDAALTVRVAAKADLFRELAAVNDRVNAPKVATAPAVTQPSTMPTTIPTTQATDESMKATASGVLLCFGRNDWDAGLPLLANGQDQLLAALAKRDAAGPMSPEESLALANDYNKLAVQSRSALTKNGAALRAAYWYEKAMPDLAGLVKTEAEKKLLSVQALAVWLPSEKVQDQLRTALLTSKWTWREASVEMTFSEDGTASHRGMRGKYVIGGPRRLQLDIDNGDRMWFVFNQSLNHYTSVGRNFGGDRVVP